MQIPSFKRLEEEQNQKGFRISSYATFMHPKPLFYKYYWWVFWKGSPCDGKDFLGNSYRMSTKQAFELMAKLRSEHESYWLYNRRLPRLDPANTPFDPHAEKWQGVEWAIPFKEDCDGEYKGHK